MSGRGYLLKHEGSNHQVLIAGGIAGLFSRFCTAPIDVVKIRLQLQTGPLAIRTCSASTSSGALPLVKQIFRHEGITGFWRGNVPAELLYLTYGSLQFTAYHLTSAALTPVLPGPFSDFVSGAFAGAAATTVTYPLDLLRTRFASQGRTRVYKSFFSSFQNIISSEGTKGLFQGLGAGVGQIVPYMGLFFCIYEFLRPTAAKADLPFGSADAIAGVVASVIAKTGVFPLDLIRKRLQVQGPRRLMFAGGAVPEYGKGVWNTGQAIVVKDGFRGLYRGLSVSLFKAAPASAITMWTYERVLMLLKE